MPNTLDKRIKEVKLDAGMYDEAAKLKMSFSEFLGVHFAEKGIDLSKSSLDPFENALRAHGLKISGRQTSLVEDFYKSFESRALFPEFINRNIRLGMELGRNECLLGDIVASEQVIDSNTYRPMDASCDEEEKGAFRVGEGAEFPTTIIDVGEKAVTLHKNGHKLHATYETIRRQTVDQLAIHLRLIGWKLRKTKVAWAIYVIINGDGNSNPAPTHNATGLTYENMIDFEMSMDKYEATTWIATQAGITTILKMSEFKDPQAGMNYQKTGNMVTPFGLNLKKHTAVAADSVVAVDKRFALEMLIERGASLVETERIIDKQIQGTVISEVIGFSKIYTDASMVWDYS